MIENLRKLNPNIEFFDVTSDEFKTFGRIIKNIDVTEITKVCDNIEKPESGSTYVASLEDFEKLEIAEIIKNELFGTLPAQIGYCWGYNNMLNATEWHANSEINVAITPLVLLVAHLWDMENGKIDSSKFKAFYLPAGTVIESYATTLHYCPCQVSDDGFKSVVGLPKGTNTDLETSVEDKMIFRKNKWIICHVDNIELIKKGVVPGITGENFEIKY